jgi:hypothetical protein
MITSTTNTQRVMPKITLPGGWSQKTNTSAAIAITTVHSTRL